MFNLNNKNILITGASSGIGKECAILANKAGARVVLIGRNIKRLTETYNMLEGENNLYYSVDLTNYLCLENIINECVSKIGLFSGFIHSAGIELTKPIQTMSAKVFEDLFAINVISAFEISRILSKKKYINPLGASFIYISSIMALYGQKGKVGYCSSKSALLGGTKALALELAVRSIRVNCILPAIVETEMTRKMLASLPETSLIEMQKKHPLGFGKPEDVANASLFLLSDLSKWITGIELVIDGGYHLE